MDMNAYECIIFITIHTLEQVFGINKMQIQAEMLQSIKIINLKFM